MVETGEGDWDEDAYQRRIVRLAYILTTSAPTEFLLLASTWHEQSPDDDIVDQLYSALVVLEGGEVRGEHWLLEGATN